MKIIQVIPTYNEAQNLPVLVSALFSLNLPEHHILIVDDNSPDGTGKIAEAQENIEKGKPIELGVVASLAVSALDLVALAADPAIGLLLLVAGIAVETLPVLAKNFSEAEAKLQEKIASAEAERSRCPESDCRCSGPHLRTEYSAIWLVPAEFLVAVDYSVVAERDEASFD